MSCLSTSFLGLPEHKFINQKFVEMTVAKGLEEGANVNPLDKRMMGCIMTAGRLMGNDSYCMNYLKAYRIVMHDP
jgi:5-methyltetrahydrofolate--homocysteine methyltransferase